jgi:predicted deacylase
LHTVEQIPLGLSTIGATRSITVHRFGTRGSGPKVFIQAGLHANEIPGILTVQHILGLLEEADEKGEIVGEIVVVPFANPIGLGTYVLGNQVGRYALETGINFNRGFPDLGAIIAPAIANELGSDAQANISIIRKALNEAVAALPAKTEIEYMRRVWLGLAVDCDYLLDMHCEEEAQFAMILGPWCWPGLKDVVAHMKPDKLFLADFPPLFDTACSRPWHDLAERFPNAPIPQACLSVTLELRGVGSVSDSIAQKDARHAVNAIRAIGAVADPVEQPPLELEAQPFKTLEFVRAPAAGIVVYKYKLGDRIEAGAVVAEIVNPACENTKESRIPVYSTEAGTLFAKCHTYLVRADETIAKVAGTKILAQPNHY